MGRDENVEIYKDTESLCKSLPSLKAVIENSTKNQKLILENDKLQAIDNNRFSEAAKIIVSKKRTYEAAERYKDTKVAVHNFASATNPGGGVERGANAQEECLCRTSTLFFNLNTKAMWDGFYSPHRAAHNPINNGDIIYTPDVMVIKSDTALPKRRPENEWYKVDVITCAAPNLREKPSNAYNSHNGSQKVSLSLKEQQELHEKRLRKILDVAVINGVDSIILGAFGCGAFMNSPEAVAKAAKNVITDYMKAFKNIEFAVYCSPRDDTNYKVFERILK